MGEHRHNWSVGWDGYVCDVEGCSAERSFGTEGLGLVVVEGDRELRVVEAVLAALRAEDGER